ncbi:MAG: prepilin peptidase [Oscillospiraceae bacterium]|nr:prepilin peptidase [Oscillospiraceae bacterium]
MTQTVAVSALLLFLTWVSVHDIRTHKIENISHLVIIIAAFFVNDLNIAERILGCIVSLIPFLTANIFSGNRLGMGDVKLVGAFGFVLGVYGGITAAVAGLCLMLLTVGVCQKIKKQNKAVPLAPFLCGGFALILLFS